MNSNTDKIAVVGMACRFPGAKNINDYWNNLLEGKDSIYHFTDEELSKFEVDYENLKNNPNYIKARGILTDIDMFDADFFGMTPKEAAGTDPQHRIWLENAWSAFENAGCDPVNYPGVIGVFAGGYLNTYLLNNILRDPVKLENYIRLRSTESYQIMTGNDAAFIPTKTAYKFNLKGPAINVQTACSTSLVAISQACQSLLSFESDICLAGGVCIVVPQESGYIYQEGSIPSPDGTCRPFDAKGEGTVFSNGVGAVVLKRYEDAVRDRDTIYALVRGWALNNDGSNKVSYMAPSVEGQSKAILMAQSFAEVEPEDICYIEAHGTATQLGDPIEIAALKKAFSLKTNKKQFCGIGSVKSNIGHTDAAAGVASFIKTCLAAYYRIIPATLNFSEANKHIDFGNSPFFVQKELKKWTGDKPLIMGVSSFGIGGTNAHIIVEENTPYKVPDTTYSDLPELILLSAKSKQSLDQRKIDLIEFVKANRGLNIHDIAFTLGTGRNHMRHRSFMVTSGTDGLISSDKTFNDGLSGELNSKIAFMFPGQGAQYVSMGRDLYNSNQYFRQILDECFLVIYSEIGVDIKALLFKKSFNESDEQNLARTEITQPALFIIEYALAKLLNQYEIRPDYMIGHSIGEYVAACMAGVFDLQTALKIVIRRGQLMQRMKAGNMMAVRTGIENLRNLNTSLFEIAADNSNTVCSISFMKEDTNSVKELLEQNKIQYTLLNTSHGFHSAAFDPIMNEFSEYVNQFELKSPSLPFISCLTGGFIKPDQATSGSYWAQQLRNTVLFRQGISLIAQDEGVLLLEVGPNTHLSSLARQNKDVLNKKAIITTLDKPGDVDENFKIIETLGNLFNLGINLNISAVQNEINPHKVSLPTYPFDRKRHWIDFELPHIENNQKTAASVIKSSENTESKSIVPEIAGSKIELNYKNTDIILRIWRNMTGIDKIGFDDDFFELGGQSLLALQILTRIKEELDINISLKTFYDNPTINKLGALVSRDSDFHKIQNESTQYVSLTNLPLSTSQRGIWIISQFDNLNPAYNIPFTYHLTGNVNTDVFQKAINVLFNRHPVIFSTFTQKDGIPSFNIVPNSVTVNLIDFSGESPENGKKQVYDFAGKDARKVFDIESGPLYRLYLFKLDDTNYYFHATIHHLVFDGWSWSIFINDFGRIYESLLLNREPELEPIEFHYHDYVKWQESFDNKYNEEISRKFWIEYLKDCSPVLNFPYDLPRKEKPSGYGCKEYIRIESDYTARLREVSKKENSTIFATLLSAVGILFQKYSGENDICIGTPTANRIQSKFEKIFGMFVNTIVLRLKFEEGCTFSQLIRQTKNTILDTISHSDLAFDRIVDAIKPDRVSNMNPLFQVSVVWLTNSAIPINLPGVKGEPVTINEGVSPGDITFYLWENGDFIEGEIEYNIDILNRDSIIRLRDNLVQLVETLVDDIDQTISNISIVSDTDKQKISEFNKTDVPVPDCLIHNLFENQVKLIPKKTAIISGGRKLTYQELENQSNQIANHLIGLGVISGDIVGICMERSVDMVVSVLGILKAGCCYLPLDPLFPGDRLGYMFEDSGARILISQSSIQDKFVHFPKAEIVLTDTDKSKIDKSGSGNLGLKIITQSLAYLIYTSGSTGKPKGVKVHHQGVVNFLCSMSKRPGISNGDRLLAVTTLSFDISVLELFLPLSFGAEVIIADTEDIFEGKKLSGLLDLYDITIMQATPATWNILLSSGWRGKSNLKSLCGGEAILPGLVKELLPKVESLWDMYGPTETTVWSTCKQLTNSEPPILVGTPIDNTTVQILDKNNNQLPVGVIGEVCIGGLGVAKGYHNRPELTEEKFIHSQNGQVIYKTGDLGRFLINGNIELFGRIDNQIKMRGFRIEPGEIESLISKFSGVKEVVVKVHKFDETDERLVAFLNVETGFNLTNEEITDSLSKQLPAYMIPSLFNISDSFPRLPNGKINKKELIFHINESVKNPTIDLSSLTITQQKIFKIWESILKIKNLAPSDNFFDIGGNSLLVIRITNKIREEIGFTLSFKEFIAHPTIINTGNYIDSLYNTSHKAIELVHQTNTTNLPLTLTQKRLWLFSKLQPNIPSYVIGHTYKLIGSLNRDTLQKSIEFLFERHNIVFSVIKEKEGEPYIDIIRSKVDISFSDYAELPKNEISDRLNNIYYEDSRKVFDLQNGPLYRLYLIRIDSDEYIIRISIHHIIFDGWSWGVLVRDLNKIYNNLLVGKEVDLETIEFQQYDYAHWEKNSVGSIYENKSIEFWKENLNGASSVLNFPYDFKHPNTLSGRGSCEAIHLSQDLSEKIRNISKNERVSLLATIFSAFGLQMQRYSGEDDINIGLPVAHRPHSLLENIFGMFVNSVVVRLNYEKDFSFKKIIQQTNIALLNAIAHQDLPFEKVVEIVNPDRSSTVNPLFQVAFAWQNNLDEPIKLEGIRSERITPKKRSSIFDITLYMWENGNQIEGEFEYNCDVLRDETIIKLRDNLLNLINNLVEKPDSPIGSLSMTSDKEKELIDGFNNTITDYPKDKTLIQLFEEQVKINPDKISVVFKEISLTYNQLNIKANQLARKLREYGVRNNDPVGILAERTPDMIIGILAILKAGGGYVPVDPEYPIARRDFIINDSGCKILLVQDKFNSLVVESVIKINLNASDVYAKDDSNVESNSYSTDLAYIMYTSGTTGTPKGSLILQKGVVRLVRNINYMELTSEDRILLTGSIVFDATTFEIWGALLNGATLYLVEKETIINPKVLGEELEKNEITVLWLTSPLLTQIAETHADIFGKLKWLLSGGDVLSAAHINKIRKVNPQLKVLNCYGPTENTTFSTTYLIENDFENNIPVGKPISNSTTYIFDKTMNYQPIGVIGELFVGGDGLSKGYLNREDLNLKSFLDHPDIPGERLYRTGDYARWLPDGNIEFHGRIDNQLKIRGFRVELGEIESVLSKIEGVVEAVVKPLKINEGDVRLAAFLNVTEGFSLDTKELNLLVMEKLPPYMVPSGFKLMHGFPKTINGKINKEALTIDLDDFVARENQHPDSLTNSERKILGIWCDVLKMKDIITTDNFFEIGGNSLLAISVMSKIESAFNIELGLRVFFDGPRIKDLGEAIDIMLQRKEVPGNSSRKSDKESVNIIEGEI